MTPPVGAPLEDRLDRVFAWIWRLNALLLLPICGAGIVLVGVLIGEALDHLFKPRRPALVEVAGSDVAAESLEHRASVRRAGLA
jgi:hypothetical protein